jgi:hypothetical protein
MKKMHLFLMLSCISSLAVCESKDSGITLRQEVRSTVSSGLGSAWLGIIKLCNGIGYCNYEVCKQRLAGATYGNPVRIAYWEVKGQWLTEAEACKVGDEEFADIWLEKRYIEQNGEMPACAVEGYCKEGLDAIRAWDSIIGPKKRSTILGLDELEEDELRSVDKEE